MTRRLLVGVLFVVGCKGKGETKDHATPAAGSGSGSAVATQPAAGSGKGSGKGAGSGSAAVVEDPKARAAYRAGMSKGRKATDKKQWADAIAGFDAALAAKKNDPRALGERGFARLLEGSDLAAATRDLDAAAGGTKDPKLLSQIWFNRGLVEEKRGNAANATAAFVVANTLRPTAAALKKITGKPPCPIVVARDVAGDPDHSALEGADWLALAKQMPHDESDPPKTAADALRSLFGDSGEPTLPTAVVASDFTEKIGYVVWRHGTNLHAQPVAYAMGGRCPGEVDVGVAKADATWIHVQATELVEGGYTFMCEAKNGDLEECTGADNEVGRGTACFGGTPTRKDLVIELATGKVALELDQPEAPNAAKAELVADGIKLAGLGCDRVEPLK